MSLTQKQYKTKRARLRHKRLKHKEYRTSSKSEPKREPAVSCRQGEGYLTEHLFKADEQELRTGLKMIEVEIKGARRRSAKKKLKNCHKILSDRLVSLGYNPTTMSKAQILGFKSFTRQKSSKTA